MAEEHVANYWSEKERMAFERHALGVNIAGHPLDPFEDQISRLATHSVAALNDEAAGMHWAWGEPSWEVTMAGIASDVVVRSGRTDASRRTAVGKLEDQSGQIEFVVPADAFQDCRELLSQQAPLLVRGTLHIGDFADDQRATLIVRGVTLLSELAREDSGKEADIS